MFGKLLILFVTVPLVEILILIKLGEVIGFWNTVFFVIGTGFLGALLARLEGLRAWKNFRRSLEQGRMPAEHMLDALLIFVSGALLITPGLITDLAGLFLLIPWTRFAFKRWLRRKFNRMIEARQSGGFTVYRF